MSIPRLPSPVPTYEQDTAMRIRRIYDTHQRVALGWSGEDALLLDVVVRAVAGRSPVRAFVLDTGFLFPETRRFIADVAQAYRVSVVWVVPRATTDSSPVTRTSLATSEVVRQACCQARKVEPLRAQLQALDAWCTGRRAYQNPATRAQVPLSEPDHLVPTVVKYNPLIHWTVEQVADYHERYQLPVNPLKARGYESIGCTLCTAPGQGRTGRFAWLAPDAHRECGIHLPPVSVSE